MVADATALTIAAVVLGVLLALVLLKFLLGR